MSNVTLLIGTMCLVAASAGTLLRAFRGIAGQRVERSAGLDRLESRVYVLDAENRELHARVVAAKQTRDRLVTERERLESENRKIEKAVNETLNQPPLHVHELGDPREDTTRFIVELSREALSSRGRETRAPVSPLWSRPNVAEVWAHSQDEARQIVDTAFPTKQGFKKSFTIRPSEAERLLERLNASGRASP